MALAVAALSTLMDAELVPAVPAAACAPRKTPCQIDSIIFIDGTPLGQRTIRDKKILVLLFLLVLLLYVK